jgi:dTMP kinase
MEPEKRRSFFKWLYEYEFDLIGLPAPDMVFYMDIDAELADLRLKRRQAETGTSGDIHEKDTGYLSKCAQSGRQAAVQYGWSMISCVKNGLEQTEIDIHQEIYDRLFHTGNIGASGRM